MVPFSFAIPHRLESSKKPERGERWEWFTRAHEMFNAVQAGLAHSGNLALIFLHTAQVSPRIPEPRSRVIQS